MSRFFFPLAALIVALPNLQAEPAAIRIVRNDSGIDFLAGEELIARYHTDSQAAKPYFWPLNAPGGTAITRGWPMVKDLPKETKDHVHQKSAWFCHGDVIPVGLELKIRSADKRVKGVDFWSETPGHGKIVAIETAEPKVEGSRGSILTKNEWRAADGTKILDETRTIHVRDLGHARLIVLEIDLHASVCPIVFGDTKEGSMGVRVSDEFRLSLAGSDGRVAAADGTAVTAPAKDNLPMWGKRADWHDYSGSVGGKRVGIAIFDHPANQPRAAWHTRAYGLLAANPFGRASFPNLKGEEARLDKDARMKLKYALYLHLGDEVQGKVADAYQAFARE